MQYTPFSPLVKLAALQIGPRFHESVTQWRLPRPIRKRSRKTVKVSPSPMAAKASFAISA
jgi:hypothetical protein